MESGERVVEQEDGSEDGGQDDIDDCQTPSELLASFVAASVSSGGLKSQPGAD